MQKTSEIQKKPSNLVSNGMEKSGVGCGSGETKAGKQKEEPMKLRTERDL